MTEPFQYPKQKILDTIAGLSEEDQQAYPAHIYEPERIEIARELALKEYFKLFSFLKEKDFVNMDNAMIKWFDGRDTEMAPVHDYWNFVGGTLLSLKLKDIVPYLTSENITWHLETLDTKAMSLYWAVGTLSHYGNANQKYTYDFVKAHIIDQPDERAENIRISDEKSNDTTVNRDRYPILVGRQLDGSLKLMDGNRRLMRAWLHGDDTISAWVGTVNKEPMILNQWVGTDFLRRLLSEYTQNPTDEVFSSVRSQLKIAFTTSSIAKYHYKKRCLHINGAKELAEGLYI